MEDERVAKLEEEIKKLKSKLNEREDEEAIRDRQDLYRASRVDNKLLSQEIHGNLKGLASDDHTHYLNNSRHDTTARHGTDVIGGPYEPSFTKNTAFNKDFGVAEGSVCEGNDSRLSDNRTPVSHGNESHDEDYIVIGDVPTGETEEIEVITDIDFVSETFETVVLQFVDGLYKGIKEDGD